MKREFIKSNKLILKTQQRFKRERHNVVTEEINKISLRLNDDKRMPSIDSIETNAYLTSKDLILIADILSNKRLYSIVTELFIRGRKLDISLVFITQSNFVVPKNIRINSAHYFIMKVSNKQELQQTSFSHSSDNDFRNFMNLHKKYTVKPYYFLVINVTLASDNPSLFRKNLLERK